MNRKDKIFYICAFCIGGALACFSAKTDVEMLIDPNQQSVLESVFDFEYADLKKKN